MYILIQCLQFKSSKSNAFNLLIMTTLYIAYANCDFRLNVVKLRNLLLVINELKMFVMFVFEAKCNN